MIKKNWETLGNVALVLAVVSSITDILFSSGCSIWPGMPLNYATVYCINLHTMFIPFTTLLFALAIICWIAKKFAQGD